MYYPASYQILPLCPKLNPLQALINGLTAGLGNSFTVDDVNTDIIVFSLFLFAYHCLLAFKIYVDDHPKVHLYFTSACSRQSHLGLLTLTLLPTAI